MDVVFIHDDCVSYSWLCMVSILLFVLFCSLFFLNLHQLRKTGNDVRLLYVDQEKNTSVIMDDLSFVAVLILKCNTPELLISH